MQRESIQKRGDEIRVLDPKKDCYVKAGFIKDNFFCRPVVRGRHFLRALKGYALQKEVVQELVKLRVDGIRITEETGKTLEVSLEKFVKQSIFWEKGHGAQYVIPESLMEVK